MATAIGSFDWADLMLESTDLEAEPVWNESPEPPRGSRCTLIQTAHSTYLFLVTAPAERLGLLVGGALGESPTSAVFMGAIPHENRASRHASQLGTSWRMVFEIAAEEGRKRLITGPVVKVVQAPVDSHDSQEAQS